MSLEAIENKTLWLDTSDYSRMLTTAGGSAPTAPDDQIYQFTDASASALVLVAPSETTGRPFLRDNGSGKGELDCLNSTANRYLSAGSSTATFDHILAGSGGIAFRLRVNTGLIGSGELYFDNRAGSAGNKGFTLQRASSNERLSFFVSNGSITTLTLTSDTSIVDTDEHTIIIAIAEGENACTMTQDGVVVATGTITTTTGPAGFNLRIGANASTGATPANSRFRNVLIKSVPLTAGDITAWLAYDPTFADFEESESTVQPRNQINLGLDIGL